MSDLQGIFSYWSAFLFGLFGLAFRWSRMGLPNGGTEPKTPIEQLVRLLRLWLEATVGSIIFIAIVFVSREFYPVINNFIFLALAMASLLGAALSDTIGVFIQNPAVAINWIRDTIMKWMGK